MFLINSRTIFVTEIYKCFSISKKTNIDTPYTEAKELICRIPLTRLNFQVLAFSARASVSILGTAIQFNLIVFSLAPGINDFHHANYWRSKDYPSSHSLHKHSLKCTFILKQTINIKIKQYRNINLLSIDALS